MSALKQEQLNPFTNKNGYAPEVSPIKDAIKVAVNFFSRVKNISEEQAQDYLVNNIKGQMCDPKVRYYTKNEVGDKVEVETTLTKYIKEAYSYGECIVPSLTRYAKSEEDGGTDSLHKGFTSRNLVRRSKTKKAAAKAYADKDFWKASELTNEQKTLKLINNAMSGAFASPSTIHYNPSAHYTLTSITRSVSSIGNAVTEMVSGGNRIYMTFEHTMSHIISSVVNVDKELYIKLIYEYRVHIPTNEDLLSIIHYSSDLYYTDSYGDKILIDYFNSCSDEERCIIAYNNDLFHFYKYNQKIADRMIIELGSTAEGLVPVEEQVEFVGKQPDYIYNLMVHSCSDHLAGIDFNPSRYKETKLLDICASTCYLIQDTFIKYETIFSALFSGKVLPINVASTKEMVRRVIVLSDTDSTCGTYGHWVESVLGELKFNTFATQISASVMTIVTLSIENSINCFTGNMNVGTLSRGKLKMKNEYFWKTFAVGSGTKHYYAMVNIKEGFVYDKEQLELKGSQFIVSKTALEYRTISDEMFKEINRKITSNEKISLAYYINKVVDVERSIRKRVLEGDFTILEATEIKDASAYKKPPSSPYAHYTFWTEVFGDKYGHVDAPPYTAVKYSLSLDRKSALKRLVDETEDPEISQKLEAYFAKTGKTQMNTVMLPLDVIMNKGLPKELEPFANINRLIRTNCSAMYLILATLGFHMSDEATLLDMGY